MINVVIADDHIVLREALGSLLNHNGRYKVLGQAKDGEELVKILQSSRPDIVIMDVQMPKLDGIRALEEISKLQNPPPVLVLSANEGEATVRSALKAGAKGFIPKNAGVDEFDFAINAIVQGQTYLSPSVTAKLMAKGESDLALDNPFAVLTKREVEILAHLADGKPNREIGKLLHISTRTVDTHRSNILKKLNVKTNAELVKLAITHGVIKI